MKIYFRNPFFHGSSLFYKRKNVLFYICFFSLLLCWGFRECLARADANEALQVTPLIQQFNALQTLEISTLHGGISLKLTGMILPEHSLEEQVFALTNPMRIVIDLPEIELSIPEYTQLQQNPYIKTLHYLRRSRNAARFVLHLAQPMILKRVVSTTQTGRVFEFIPTSVAEYAEFSRQTASALILKTQGTTNPPTASKASSSSNRVCSKNEAPMIVIDPGHGGEDPGAIAEDLTYEKDLVLSYGLELYRLLLESHRYRIKLTRESDTYLSLAQRRRIVQEAHADLLISLHADTIALTNTQLYDVQGVTVYTVSDRPSDSHAADLAHRENNDHPRSKLPDTDVSTILLDLIHEETQRFSLSFAQGFVKKLKQKDVPTNTNPVRQANFFMLRNMDTPSVLIEIGYLSSASDVKRLHKSETRQALLESLSETINSFFNQHRACF